MNLEPLRALRLRTPRLELRLPTRDELHELFGLAARAAHSGALVHNVASQRVSEKLGYRFMYEDTLSPRGEPVQHRNYRIARKDWRSPVPIRIESLEPCLPLFGVS